MDSVTFPVAQAQDQEIDQVIVGTFIHTPELGYLEILKDFLCVISKDGYISHFESASTPASKEILSKSSSVRHLPLQSFFTPTWNDLHLHAAQYLYAGTGLDEPLMTWLTKYAFRAEMRIDDNAELAEKVYTALAKRLIASGTGAALLFGTIKSSTNMILAKVFQEMGLRGYIGKLSMDVPLSDPPSPYLEKRGESISDAKQFLESLNTFTSLLPPHRRLVHPVITPRFVNSVEDDTLAGLGDLVVDLTSGGRATRVQSHMSESRDQVEWVANTRQGREDHEIFDSCSLLSGSIQAHCTYISPSTIELMADRGTAVAHCPLSNIYFSGKIFPLRESLNAGVKVGLGSDIAGGYDPSLQSQMRQAVISSRVRHSNAIESAIELNLPVPTTDLRINWKESLYLATRGGALALAESKVGGMFAVGEAFDAQLIKLVGDEGETIGALDFFGEEQSLEWEEKLERWWCLGNEENRAEVYVQGKQLLNK